MSEDSTPPDVPSIVSEIDGLPLPPAVKRNLWKSVGRLIGSVADLGIAAIEHGTARVEAKTDAVKATAEARRLVKLEIAKKVPDMIAADEALSDRAVAYLGHEMLIEQTNRERILNHTVEDLRSAPPIEDPGQEVDDDWLHAFIKEASTKSAPDMQLLFGKILSGEIKVPGSFSLKAIRTLGTMSQITAKQFEALCNISVSVGDMVKVIAYSGSPATNSLKDHGVSFDVLNNLNENDLVYSDFNIGHPWKILSENRIPFDYAGCTVWLHIIDETKIDQLSVVGGVAFSKVGNELRQIVSMQPDAKYTSELIKYFETCGCELVKMIGKKDGCLLGKRYRDLI